ncbi:serine hydrolase [Lewinella sp. W8]|uniref:serine hydrolase domain-containing protein n=1 Tax=Lewinella sp. W8 TaxID=2528208 RepID=UPI0010688471|nr:serine hydrolase domain-containing protein [Lewinella sp. W8]MTB50669.1 serine hydrolase [Lewinella sp. W8]
MTHDMLRFLFLFPILLISLLVSGQTLSDDQRAALTERLMKYIPEGGPGGALGVVMGGEVVYAGYGGLADLDTETPIGPETHFNIASCAKQFTALSVLRLAREGKLKLTDDIRQYFPELYPEVREPITVNHLLTHTSGIRDMNSLWSLQGVTWWQQTLNNQDVLKLLRSQQELNFPPGSQHNYSNSNYVLLAELVARVSGQSFREYTTELFTDLGMTNTVFMDDHTMKLPNLARPYFSFDTWTTYEWLSDMVGDGALFSTLPDQLRWEATLMRGQSEGVAKELLATSQAAIFPEVTGYGYGLERGKYRGLPITYHEGSTGAWKASFIRFVDHDLTIVAMNNSGKFGTQRLVYDAADMLLEEAFTAPRFLQEPASVAEEIPVDDLLGTYRLPSGFYFRFASRDAKVFLERHERNPVEIELERGNVYHEIADPAFKQEFTRNERGELQVTAYYWSHAPYTLTRSEIDLTDYDFRAMNGSFQNEETGLAFSVQHQAEGKYQIHLGGEKLKGRLLGPDELLVQNYKLRAVRAADGSITELRLGDGNRIMNLRCVRVTK